MDNLETLKSKLEQNKVDQERLIEEQKRIEKEIENKSKIYGKGDIITSKNGITFRIIADWDRKELFAIFESGYKGAINETVQRITPIKVTNTDSKITFEQVQQMFSKTFYDGNIIQ